MLSLSWQIRKAIDKEMRKRPDNGDRLLKAVTHFLNWVMKKEYLLQFQMIIDCFRSFRDGIQEIRTENRSGQFTVTALICLRSNVNLFCFRNRLQPFLMYYDATILSLQQYDFPFYIRFLQMAWTVERGVTYVLAPRVCNVPILLQRWPRLGQLAKQRSGTQPGS